MIQFQKGSLCNSVNNPKYLLPPHAHPARCVGASLARVDGRIMDAQVNYSGHWGPVTATLDWCEVRLSFLSPHVSSLYVYQVNYQFSHYIAEVSNSFSNLFFICLSIYGAWLSSRESLPARYLVGFAVSLSSSTTRHEFALIT